MLSIEVMFCGCVRLETDASDRFLCGAKYFETLEQRKELVIETALLASPGGQRKGSCASSVGWVVLGA